MADPQASGANQRSRKRFARRQWRRRWLAWRYVVAGLLVAAVLGTGLYGVWFSSWLDVESIDVTGADNIDPDELRDRAGIDPGTPLARVDLAGAESKIRSLDIVKDVEVRREWPDKVSIEIEERVAIAVVEISGRLRALDAEGKVFREFTKAPPDLPLVRTEIGTGAPALREAALVIAALPEALSQQVDYLLVVTVDEITLFLEGGRQVVWGSSADSATKAEVLEGLLQTKADVYDVSVPTQPTTR